MSVNVSLMGRVSISSNGILIDEKRFPGRQGRLVFAYLVIEQGRPVPRDELADMLWGETPPATWDKALTGIVSKLRALLGECGVDAGKVLTSAFGCYRLELPEGSSVDILEATHATELAEAALSSDEPDEAQAQARRAVSLAGTPLLPGEDASWVDARRRELDDVLARALECLARACLSGDETAEAVKWAEEAIGLQPFRESGYRLLMDAHSAAGNRAEALRVYERCRGFLADELGAFPSPPTELSYRALLEPPRASTVSARDRAEEPAATMELSPERRASTPSGNAKRRLLRGLALTAGVTALVVGSLAFTRKGGEADSATILPNSVGVIDAASHRVLRRISLGGGPARLATGRPLVWVGSDDAQTISGINPTTHTAEKVVTIGGFPSDLAIGEGAVWVLDGERGLLFKVDPAYGAVAGRVRVQKRNLAYDRSREGVDPTAVAAGLGSVWTTDGSSRLTRVNPATVAVVDTIDVDAPLNGVTVDAGAVWAISGASATAIRIDRQGMVTTRIQIVSSPGFDSPYPLSVEAGEGYVWILNGNAGTVTKIDPKQRIVAATISIGIDRGPVRLAVGAGAVWVANGDGTATRINARTNEVETISVAHRLKDVAIVDGNVWVTAGTGLSGNVLPSVETAGIHALPTSFCGPIYYGGGAAPQFLIASDLPLQGAGRTGTAQLTDAIEFVLRRHRFRAGRYAVGYQSCDDATVPTGAPSEERCAANAGTYAQNKSVIGVIGAFTSGCSGVELPIANTAPAGPLPMVSPTNTYIGLTRRGLGTRADEPGTYYPSGRRSFVRLIPTDDFQAAADAVLAKHLSARRVFVVYDVESYGVAMARSFRSAARKLGLTIVGSAHWDYAFPRPVAIADEARRARADTIWLASYLSGDPRMGTLIRALRGARPDATLMATDGFSDFDALVRIAGSAAEGMTVSVSGPPNERLPKAGKAFVKTFGEAVGQPPSSFSVYAAQAAEILLDAIGRSDGTRASVTAELFKTKVSNGLLGNFSIDENGDTTSTAVTVYRIVRGAPKVLEVVTPARSLVARPGA